MFSYRTPDEWARLAAYIWVGVMAVTLSVLVAVTLLVDISHKSTTAPIVIHFDEGTGCQYVSSVSSRTLTPRMMPDGRQVCEP